MGRLEACVARCNACTGGPIVEDWLPISYYGDYTNANAWIMGINPSDQEFVNRTGQVRVGQNQRFRRLADFPSITGRASLTSKNVRAALASQDSIFERVPYKPFFSKIGRFLSLVHGAALSTDPLAPFKVGVRSMGGQDFKYVHVDIVKCATERPWGQLGAEEQAGLLRNCSGFLEQQLRTQKHLNIVLVNGRTAFNNCQAMLARHFRFQPEQHVVRSGRASYHLWMGDIRANNHTVQVVAWSPNIVNSRIFNWEAEMLAGHIRSVYPALN